MLVRQLETLLYDLEQAIHIPIFRFGVFILAGQQLLELLEYERMQAVDDVLCLDLVFFELELLF